MTDALLEPRGAVLSPCGEGALRVTAVHRDAVDRWNAVHHLADWLQENPIDGVYGAVPTYDSLLIEFDAAETSYDALAPLIDIVLAFDAPARGHTPQRFVLPVVYGGDFGPDVRFVADFLGITERDVIDLHTSEDRVVRCLGGPAASCMIDGPSFSAPIPRLADPRLEVPPNAISVAGAQGVIGPVRAPSGWRLIGLSPVEIMDMRSERLVPYRPGDVVRFREVSADEWDDFRGVHMADLAEAC
jgi:KipI family sensor histidine kinase inhibitor